MDTAGEDFHYQLWHEVDAVYTNFRWAEPAIIMGGENKLQAEGPFLGLFMEFRNRLRDTQRLVVVGYSFRDRHINEAIRAWMRRPAGGENPRLIVVDPSDSYRNPLDATHDEDFQVWLRNGADEPGILDLALNGSSSELLEAGCSLWNPPPRSSVG
jgi:hypothetical protein